MPITFDNLPNEVLLEILIRVPLDRQGDYRTVRFVNRYLRDVIDAHRSTILQRTASYQSLIAARASSSYPAKRKKSAWCLRRMAREIKANDEFMEDIHGVRDSAFVGKRLLEENSGLIFSHKWLLAGLYHFRSYDTIYGDEEDAEWEDEDDQHYFLKNVFPSDCIAMRHTSLVIMIIMKSINNDKVMLYFDIEEQSALAISPENADRHNRDSAHRTLD